MGAAGITSPGDFVESGFGDDLSRMLDRAFAEHVPEVEWTDNMHQGYVRLVLERDRAEATFVAVDTNLSDTFRASIINRFTIARLEHGIAFT